MKPIYIVSGLLFSTLFSCNESPTSPSVAKLYANEWTLSDLPGVGVSFSYISTLDFETDGDIKGVGICNSFQGQSTVSTNRLSLQVTSITEAFCGNEGNMLEVAYVAALEKTYTFVIDTDTLILYDLQGDRVATFWSSN